MAQNTPNLWDLSLRPDCTLCDPNYLAGYEDGSQSTKFYVSQLVTRYYSYNHEGSECIKILEVHHKASDRRQGKPNIINHEKKPLF